MNLDGRDSLWPKPAPPGLRVVMFYHSLVSDWNHGNAHFLRGIVAELQSRGCDVIVYEPHDAWSRENLLRDAGARAEEDFRRAFPLLASRRYELAKLDLDRALEGAALVLVHEWNDPDLIARVGRRRRRSDDFRLLFHDTHHRAVTAPDQMSRYDLSGYDGVLAFGETLRRIYLERGWARQAWTWHEAADARIFRPLEREPQGDLVWIGNWGDEERTAELEEFLFEPVAKLGLRARAYGVRYPEAARRKLRRYGIEYGGYLPNARVPEVFAAHRLTVHVPRRPYAEALPGIPTIRPFEALACGIPLVSAPWQDAEGLFEIGRDFLMVRDGAEMKEALQRLLDEEDLRREQIAAGLETIRERHTCAHRTDELFSIAGALRPRSAEVA